MKLLGILLLFSGWFIVFAAVALLPGEAVRAAFIACGIMIELLGLVLVTRSHLFLPRETE